jgi:hypothetical protein
MHPFPSGGEAVVFEAWERASEMSHPDELIRLAILSPHEGLRRRTGYMIENFMRVGAMEGESFRELRGESMHPIPVLQGFSYQRSDSRWQLLIP